MKAHTSRVRFLGGSALVAAGILVMAQVGPAVACEPGENGTTLSETVSVTATLNATRTWSIAKTASASTLNLFRGDRATVTYTVTATKASGTSAGVLAGSVCISNAGEVATENLASSLQVTMPPSSTAITTAPLNISARPVLAAHTSYCYPYSITIASPQAGSTYKVAANTTITNHSGWLNTPFGPSEKSTAMMPSTATAAHDSVTVNDSSGRSWPFTTSGSVSYTKEFSCSADAGTHANTASIVYTDDRTAGPSVTANVTVKCYDLGVTKTATTSLTRTYIWNIDKSVDPTSVAMGLHETADLTYSIQVAATPRDSGWTATGNITVSNPAPMAAGLTSLSDSLTSVSCPAGVTFPYVLPANATLTCSYVAHLASATSGTNVATTTLRNSPSGTTAFTGSADFTFDNAKVTTVDAKASVSDTYVGPYVGTDPSLPRTVNASDSPISLSYTREVGPYSSLGTYSIDNTATVRGFDTQTTHTASVSVPVTVSRFSPTSVRQTVSATGNLIQTFGWTIDKTVSPGTIDMFVGDQTAALYTVTVTKDNGVVQSWLNGEVCVTNTGAYPTDGLASTVSVTAAGSSTVIATAPLDISSAPELNSGASACYAYSINVPSPVAGTDYTVTANTTILNYTGHLGSAYGPTTPTTTTMPSATLVHNSVTVSDSNSEPWTTTASAGVSYGRTFGCSDDEGMNDNTAVISYNDNATAGPQASAVVTVNCYSLDVTKTAATSLTRTYLWAIDKSVDQTSLTLGLGQTTDLAYTIVASATTADSNWAAKGTITVMNPAPVSTTLTGVTDAMNGSTGAVTCGPDVSFPYTLAAGASLACTYTLTLPNAEGGTNIATATVQNTSQANRDRIRAATTDFTGTALVDFAMATITSIDKTATLTDSFTGPFVEGTDPQLPRVINADNSPLTITYGRVAGPYNETGTYPLGNTATVTANDTSAQSTAGANVRITVVDLHGSQLSQQVSADPTYVQSYTWSVGKTASPATLGMFQGDSGTSTFAVSVQKTPSATQGTITGQVCITDTGTDPTVGLMSTLTVTDLGSETAVGSGGLDVSSHPALQPGETHCYPYALTIISPAAGHAYAVTDTSTVTNYNSHQGSAYGPTTTTNVNLPEVATPIHNSVTVTDSNGLSWGFSNSGSVAYSQVFSCNADRGSHSNTVTLTYPTESSPSPTINEAVAGERNASATAAATTAGPSATATVTVDCYNLAVTKTAATSLTRTHTWTVEKTADQSSLTLGVGDSTLVNYTVTVASTSADSAWAATGTITVNNPAPIGATLAGITDVMGTSAAVVTCPTGVAFPYTLAAGATLSCTYVMDLTGPVNGTNTATVSQQNVPSGSTSATATAAVDFTTATVKDVDGTATLTDSFAGPFVDANATLPLAITSDETPVTFTYGRNVGPYATAGSYSIGNTATVTATDSGTSTDSSVTIPVTVSTGGGGGEGGGGSNGGQGGQGSSGGLPHTGGSPVAPGLLLLGIVLTGAGILTARRTRRAS